MITRKKMQAGRGQKNITSRKKREKEKDGI
jgi:hypothetical protein